MSNKLLTHAEFDALKQAAAEAVGREYFAAGFAYFHMRCEKLARLKYCIDLAYDREEIRRVFSRVYDKHQAEWERVFG